MLKFLILFVVVVSISTNIFAQLATPTLISPADSSSNLSLNPSLIWHPVDSAASYNLQVSTSSSFDSFLQNQVISDTSFNLTGLNWNNQYFWRVRAMSSTDTSEWSSVWYFTTQRNILIYIENHNSVVGDTIILPIKIIGGIQSNGIYSISLRMSYNDSILQIISFYNNIQGSFSYNWSSNQFSIVWSNSSALNIADSSIIFYVKLLCISNKQTQLVWDTVYTRYNGTVINNLTNANINIYLQILPPTLLTPINNATNISINPTFSWHSDINATSYSLQVSTNSVFDSLIINQNEITDSLYQANNLGYNTQYFWRVKAMNSIDTSVWSSIWSFTTRNQSPNLDSGLVAFYPFNGNANDMSGHGYNGSVNGAALTTDRFGNANNAYYFNGSSYIDMRYSMINIGQNQYTISHWINISNLSATMQTSINTYPHTGIDILFNYYPDNYRNRLMYSIGNDLSGNWINADRGSKSDFNANQWYNVTMVKNGTNYKYFVNNELDYEINIESAADFNYNVGFTIGANCGYWQNFYGKIDDIRIYNRALTSTELAMLFNEIPPPILVSPSDSATNIQLNTSIIWQQVSNALSYSVQISNSSSFDSILNNQVVTDTIFNLTGLSYNTQYFYRVRAMDSVYTSVWSSIRTFTTIQMAAPTLISPADSATNIPLNKIFSWNSVSNAQTYTLQISKTSSFDSLVVNQTSLTDTNFTATGLRNSTFYYWRVKSVDSSLSSNWSIVRCFTTLSLDYGLVAYYPFNGNANDESGNGHNGTVNGATLTTDRLGYENSAYSFDGSTNSIDIGDYFIFQDFTISLWVYRQEPQNLLADIFDNNHTSTINFVLQSGWTINSWGYLEPPSTSVNFDLNTNMWYHILIVRDSNSNIFSGYLNDSLIATVQSDPINYSSQSFTFGSHHNHTRNFHGKIDDIRFFNRKLTQIEISMLYNEIPPIGKPILVSPQNNQTNIIINSQLSWHRVNDSISYRVQVSTTNIFDSLIQNQVISDTSFSLANLSYNTQYFWRVRAMNSTDTSGWSEVWSFTTECPTPKQIDLKLYMQGLWSGSAHKKTAAIVELRQGSTLNSSIIVSNKSGIIDSSGHLLIDFSDMADGNYWVVVRASGYMPLAITSMISLPTCGGTNYDFTTSVNQSVGGINALIQIGNSWLMRAGDFNSSRNVNSTDLNILLQNNGKSLSGQVPPQ